MGCKKSSTYGLSTSCSCNLPPHLVVKFVTMWAHRLPAVTRLQVRGNVTFINVLVTQLKSAILPAASRETPGPTGGGGGFLFYLLDTLINRDFLVDTGASRSVFPNHSSAAPTGPHLLMADSSPAKVWGTRTLPLQLADCHFSSCSF